MSKAVPQKNPSIASSVAAGCSPPYSRTSLESRGLGVTVAPNLAQATLSDQQAHCHSMCQSSPLQDSHVIHAAVHPLSSILTFDAQYPWGCDVHRSLGLPALSTPTGHSLCYWPNDSGVSIQQQFTCNPTCAGLQGSWSADSVQLLQQQLQQHPLQQPSLHHHLQSLQSQPPLQTQPPPNAAPQAQVQQQPHTKTEMHTQMQMQVQPTSDSTPHNVPPPPPHVAPTGQQLNKAQSTSLMAIAMPQAVDDGLSNAEIAEILRTASTGHYED